jgi:hypothetical protein
MVHAMTWLPIKMFTSSVMEGAVDCWCWAMVGRPELELLVKIFFLNSELFVIRNLIDCRGNLQSLGENYQRSTGSLFD